MRLPASMGLVLQGLLLFPLLAGSIFSDYRLKLIKEEEAV
jgi:general nucleoside transport system permease protein